MKILRTIRIKHLYKANSAILSNFDEISWYLHFLSLFLSPFARPDNPVKIFHLAAPAVAESHSRVLGCD